MQEGEIYFVENIRSQIESHKTRNLRTHGINLIIISFAARPLLMSSQAREYARAWGALDFLLKLVEMKMRKLRVWEGISRLLRGGGSARGRRLRLRQ